MDYGELKKCTVVKLREILNEQAPDLKGASSMKKDELVEALAAKLGIEKIASNEAPTKKVAKATKKKSNPPRAKAVIKAEIKALKQTKNTISGDRAKRSQLHVELHDLRRELKKAVKKSV